MKKGILRILFTNARVQYFLFTIGLAMPCFFMAYTEPLAWYSRILQVVFGVSFFLSVMAVKRRPSRSLYINFIFAFFGCFQLALLYLYGNSPVAVDMFLNTISTNANEAGELLGNLLLGVIMSCGLYISILLLGLASWHRQVKLDKVWHRHFRRMVALPLFVVSTSAAVLLQLFTPFRISVDLYPVNVTYNFGVAIYRFFQLKNYKYNTPNFMFESQATHESD